MVFSQGKQKVHGEIRKKIPPKMGNIPGNLQKEQPAVVQRNIPELKVGSFGF